MFQVDQPKVSAIALGSPEGTKWVALLAIVSAQQHFYKMGDALVSLQRDGAQAWCLYGPKRAGWAWLETKATYLWAQISEWNEVGNLDPELVLSELLKVPGMGMVKAGFFAQMTLGVTGCLDSHNMERLGFHPRTIRWPSSAGPSGKALAIRRYLAAVSEAGGSEVLWNDWCRDMARRHPTRFADAQVVSAYHHRALPLRDKPRST